MSYDLKTDTSLVLDPDFQGAPYTLKFNIYNTLTVQYGGQMMVASRKPDTQIPRPVTASEIVQCVRELVESGDLEAGLKEFCNVVEAENAKFAALPRRERRKILKQKKRR